MENAGKSDSSNLGPGRLRAGGQHQMVIVNFEQAATGSGNGHTMAAGGKLAHVMMNQHLNIPPLPEEFGRINPQVICLNHCAGDEIGKPACRIGNVRPFFVNDDFKLGINPARLAGRTQACRYSSYHNEPFGDHSDSTYKKSATGIVTETKA